MWHLFLLWSWWWSMNLFISLWLCICLNCFKKTSLCHSIFAAYPPCSHMPTIPCESLPTHTVLNAQVHVQVRNKKDAEPIQSEEVFHKHCTSNLQRFASSQTVSGRNLKKYALTIFFLPQQRICECGCQCECECKCECVFDCEYVNVNPSSLIVM